MWAHFKTEGWRSQNGHELSYDHYYIKPGKNVKTDVEGEDFFLGERELVSYGLRMRIFGEPKGELLGVASPSHVQEVLLSQQQPDERDSDGNEGGRSRRASRKRQRRSSRERDSSPSSATSSRRSSNSSRRSKAKRKDTKKKKKRRGSRADDPISLLSGSSTNGSDASGSDAEGSADDGHRRRRRRKASVSSSSTSGDESWTGNDGQGGFHDPDDDLDDDEEEDSPSVSEDDDSSENQENEEGDDEDDEEVLDDDLEVVHGAPSVAGGKMRAKDASYLARERTQHRSPSRQKNSRPRLKTSNGKKERATSQKHHDHHQQHRSGGSSRDEASNSHKRKQFSTRPSAGKRPHKHHKRSPSASPESCFDDDDFSLGADQYGASPPRRPPTSSQEFNSQRRRSVPSTPTSAFTGNNTASSTNHASTQRRRASVSSVRATPASHSFLSPSSQGDDNSFEVDEMESADHFDSAETPPTTGDYETPSSPVPTPSTPSPTTSTATSTSWTETPQEASSESSKATDLATTLLELRDVVFPQDSDSDKYHVLVATQRDGVMRIVLENARSHEHLECAFRDVKELPGNSQEVIPGKAVIEALLRCLRSLPGAVVVNPGTFADSKEDTGKIELVGSSNDAATACPVVSAPAASSGAGPVTLRFAFPCFDFWRCAHNFPMKLVPSSQARVASLMAELKAVKTRLSDADEQLRAAMRDRDELKTRVEAFERERDTLQRTLVETEKKSQLALQQRDSASELQVAQLNAQVTQLKEQVTQLKARVAQLKDNPPASTNATSDGGASDSNHNTSASQSVSDRQMESEDDDRPAAMVIVVVQSPWLKAFMPRIAEAVTRAQQSAMDWDAIVAIEKEYYHADADDTTGRVNAITVLKSGTYQVNAHMTHEKNVRMALHIESSSDSDGTRHAAAGGAAATLVGSTLVQMYDNKRRISRADRVLSLHANDRVAMVLLPAHVTGTSGDTGPVDGGGAVRESWPPVFRPQPNQLALTYLDPQLVYDSASAGTTG